MSSSTLRSLVHLSPPPRSRQAWQGRKKAQGLRPLEMPVSAGAAKEQPSSLNAARAGPVERRLSPNVRCRRPTLCRASSDDSEGVPQEVLEDTKFVRISNDDPRFGPPVMLLLGFSPEEVPRVQEMLDNMGGDFLRISVCTQKMADGTLSAAIHTLQDDISKVQAAASLPRICVLSGLTGEEIMMVVGNWPESGLRPTVFAAMVPNNANKPMKELIEEIMGDHERLSGSRAKAKV